MHDVLEVKSSVLLAELELHKTEYTTVRQEINVWHDAVKKYHDLCLLSIAAGFGITPIVIQYRIQAIFLLFPLLFYLMILRIEYSFIVIRKFGAYLVDVLTPRVNSILDQLGADRQGIKVLGWQDYWNQ